MHALSAPRARLRTFSARAHLLPSAFAWTAACADSRLGGGMTG
jgi:hypothetical protein